MGDRRLPRGEAAVDFNEACYEYATRSYVDPMAS